MFDQPVKIGLMVYKEETQVVCKLFEMLQLFVSVNGSLAHSSAHLQKSTHLMNQMIVFLMTAQITSKKGESTTFHQHFVKSDESHRLNSD